MNKPIVLATLFLLVAAGPAFADAEQDAAMVPVHQFIDAMNKGDMKTAATAYAPRATILDEFPPYHWQGKAAFARWAKDYETAAKAAKMTEPVMAPEAARKVSVTGDRAYAVVPARFSFKQDGHPVGEEGSFAFALTKTPKGWRIAGWAWTWDHDLK